MKESYLRKFALLFSILLLLQESNALLTEQLVDNYRVRKNIYSEDQVTAVELSQSREKRWVGTALIIISAASAGLDIYKQVAGCKQITPELDDKIREGKELQQTLLRLKDEVNLAWVPAESREEYTKRLASNMIIIREQIATYDSLQADLVKLLDQHLIDALNQLGKELEIQVDKNNATEIGSFEDLEGKYMEKTAFAITLAAKLLPVGFLLGTKYLLPKITARFTKGAAKTWASSNPSRVQKMLDGFAEKQGKLANWRAEKIASFKATLNTKWNTFKLKFPRITNALNRMSNSKVGKALGDAMGKVKSVAVNVGKGAVVAFFAAFEVWNFIQFHGQCKEKYDKALEGISTMTTNKNDMEKLKQDISDMKNKADEYYNLMKSNVTNDEFINFIGQIAELGENAQHQTPEIVTATNQIKQYQGEIKAADDQKTDELNTMLVSAFTKINFKLDCLRSKLAIIAGVRDDCAIGMGNYDDIYARALAKQKKITETCIEGHYMNKDEIKGIMFVYMDEDKKQRICIRNNPTKKQLVCEKWYDDVSDADILQSNPDLTQSDVSYFISTCPPADVNSQLRDLICVRKNTELVSLQVIQQKYVKYDQAKINSAYQECQLSPSSVNVICTAKNDGHPVSYAQAKFPVFPASMVANEYNSCKKEINITPADKAMICQLKAFFPSLDAPIFQQYKDKYDEAALQKCFNNC